jgi:hypothetical protein
MVKRAYPYERLPADPERQNYYAWLPANRSFYANFRSWLSSSGYSTSALHLYSQAARHALGFL